MKQIVFIHGGMTFKRRSDYLDHLKEKELSIEPRKKWHGEYLRKRLKDFQIIKPDMPCKENARYAEWKIYFERFLPFMNHGVILIGSSLGSIFLARYLSRNMFPKRISSLYLLGAPFDDTLPTEDLAGGFRLPKDISGIMQANKVTFLYSKDDDIVPVSHAEKYRKKLPNAEYVIFESKNGHFRIDKFPEIIRMIRKNKNY